jgi:RND family efflux transporter MFP subunit
MDGLMPSFLWVEGARRIASSLLMTAVFLFTALLGGCSENADDELPTARPVRTTTVEKSAAANPLTFTGRIEAADEAAVGFRISGRMIERTVGIGDRVEAGQILARLEPQNEMNALRSAQANVTAARAAVTQAKNRFERQETLLGQGWTTRAQFDEAKKARATSEAQLDSAEAQLRTAEDQVTFTKLVADAPGIVTATGAEPHEVVQAGQMIVRLAREGGRDGVFDVPAQILRAVPADAKIEVSLAEDTAVKAIGRVRTVAPQADPVTRTFEVKVGLTAPPEAMRLGATINGQVELDTLAAIEIPASALTKANRQPAVWIVDPTDLSVSLRNVEVARFDPASVLISEGLDAGDVIVTAGVHALHPGQKVRILGAKP